MKKILVLALVLIGVSSVFGQSQKTKKPVKKKITTVQTQKAENHKTTISSPITEEEYSVFLLFASKNSVVEDETNLYDFGGGGEKFLKEIFKELKQDTIEDFTVKNKKSAQIEARDNFISITNETVKKIFSKGVEMGWKEFYKKYPDSGGFSSFSRVGFSKDRNQALIFVSSSCGGLCGEGNYYLLKKENDGWKIQEKRMTWIS